MIKHWEQGRWDALQGLPSKHKKLKGDAKVCYISGYREGAESRRLRKERA